VVEDCEPCSECNEGPIPVRALVETPKSPQDEGELLGEILVWVSEGCLAAIEYAWVTDDAPTSLPDVEQIRVLTLLNCGRSEA
jgi:hypothetical protein